MKILLCLLMVLSASVVYSQSGNITITEDGYSVICGKNVIVDAVWMNEGIIMADITLLDKPNSKPVTGGYKKGDEITISSIEGCTYYIFSVNKSGLNSGKGTVTLSKNPLVSPQQICRDSVNWQLANTYAVDTLDYNIFSVNKGTDGKNTAEIKITYRTAIIDNIFLEEGGLIWAGECLYKAADISEPVYSEKENNNLNSGGKITLVKQDNYTNPDLKNFNGEYYNKPLFRSEYIIRKALIYKGMKPTKEELEITVPRIWLIEIFYYSTGGASRIMKVSRDGEEITVEYNPVQTFNSESEALEYANRNGITDVKLEE